MTSRRAPNPGVAGSSPAWLTIVMPSGQGVAEIGEIAQVGDFRVLQTDFKSPYGEGGPKSCSSSLRAAFLKIRQDMAI